MHIYLEINIKCADLNRYTFSSMFSNEKVYLLKSAHFKYLSDNVYLAEKNDNGSKTVKSTKVHLEVLQQILFTSCDTVKNHSLATPP